MGDLSLTVEMLRCRNCNNVKPLSEFDRSFFNKLGYDVYCHACRFEIDEKHNAISSKQCRQCGRKKDISEFLETYSSRDGYYKECIDCQRENRTRKRYQKFESTWDGKTNICRECGKEKPTFEFVSSRYDSSGTGYCRICHADMQTRKYQRFHKIIEEVGYPLQKDCRSCGRRLAFDRFALDACKKDGLDNACLDCRKEQSEDYKRRLIESRKNKTVKKDTKKECNHCHEFKPLLSFSSDITNKDGYSDYCIECSKKQRRQYSVAWKEDRVKKKLKPKNQKCRVCNEIKSIDMFSKNKYHKFGFYRVCDDCRKQQQKLYEENWEMERKKSELEFTFDVLTEKKCKTCGKIIPISGFGDRKASKDGKTHYCLKCLKIKDKKRREILKKRGIVFERIPNEKYCPGCKRTLSSDSFRFNSTSYDCLDGECKDCRKKYYDEYYRRPEVQKRQKAYRRLPEVKARRRIISKKSYHKRKKEKEILNKSS